MMRVFQTRGLLLATGLLAASSCSLAWAAPAAAGNAPLPSYTELDKDKDGIVTMAEIDVYPPGVAARLHHCDSNKDKQVSRQEYAQCSAPAHTHAPAK